MKAQFSYIVHPIKRLNLMDAIIVMMQSLPHVACNALCCIIILALELIVIYSCSSEVLKYWILHC